MTTQERIFNKTFNPGDDDGMFNACVGENGFVDKQTYSIGFAEAVDILTSALEAMDERANLDTLIYPICFCARHHVELFLKAQIDQIAGMRGLTPKLPGKQGASVSSTHDLGNLWTVFASLAVATDRRYIQHVAEIEEFVQDIAQIDPTGQTFRYPTDTESVKHLIATPVINVLSLRRRFKALVSKIEAIELLSDALSHEYRHGSHTTKLSRADLQYIALNLPLYETWARSDDVVKAKARIMQMFAISSNDFNRAAAVIKGHPEFAPNIGLYVPIAGLDRGVIDNFSRILSDELSVQAWSTDEMGTIEAIYEIARADHLSEEFQSVQQHLKREFAFERYTQGQLGHRARSIPRFLAGLQKLGQLDLAEYARHSLDASNLLNRLKRENEEFARRHPNIGMSLVRDQIKASSSTESEPSCDAGKT
ncbi:hypothetical protein AB2N08_17630 [Massilia aurea]|uniref:hypothetical protein n=1 Tax=Massilia aurea TaxID=373040 RepID=UPI003462DCE3